jgi:hypothetical protein
VNFGIIKLKVSLNFMACIQAKETKKWIVFIWWIQHEISYQLKLMIFLTFRNL